MTDELIELFEAKSKPFVDNFVHLFAAKHVTPYMHCMMQHVKTQGSNLPFTQQGMEKYKKG